MFTYQIFNKNFLKTLKFERLDSLCVLIIVFVVFVLFSVFADQVNWVFRFFKMYPTACMYVCCFQKYIYRELKNVYRFVGYWIS